MSGENESAEIVGMDGVVAADLLDAFEEMRALSRGTRCRKAVYHASINVAADEAESVGQAKWQEAADELGRRLGLEGHQRVLVLHRKHGREHLHVVWGRVNPVTLRTTSDGGNYRKHEQVSRALEERWGLKPVVGVHTRPEGHPRPVAQATHQDWQASVRTGIPAMDVARRLHSAWAASTNGASFKREVEALGLCLASGRRGIVAVDEAGTPHSLARRLGKRAAEVRARLADLGAATLPTVERAKIGNKKGSKTRENVMGETDNTVSGASGTAAKGQIDWDWIADWWRQNGVEVHRAYDGIWFEWLGARWHDRGDRIEVQTEGEPTDEQMSELVRACRERWTTVRFFGSEEFQRRARIEAIRQGVPPENIILECEEKGGTKRPAPHGPLPDHVKKKLGIADPEPSHPDALTAAEIDELGLEEGPDDALTAGR
ncbi:relaxase/mobilization nuclease domain-containing protein [Novispirillum sp. DQ9]|uniref:relaxase/mobilization nuclease domain-containing protein n=1 Tax=Novispirillum sp. DQ9 TaxID=3398612 RepID=UPI003C7EC41E